MLDMNDEMSVVRDEHIHVNQWHWDWHKHSNYKYSITLYAMVI